MFMCELRVHVDSFPQSRSDGKNNAYDVGLLLILGALCVTVTQMECANYIRHVCVCFVCRRRDKANMCL